MRQSSMKLADGSYRSSANRRLKPSSYPLLLVLILWSFQIASVAQTVTWTDTNRNELWSDPGNWSWSNGASGVPGVDCTACDVVIPFVFSGNTTMDNLTSLTLNNITIDPEAIVLMPDGTGITVNGSAMTGYFDMNNAGNASSTLTINGNVIYTDGLQGLGVQMFDNSDIFGMGTLTNQGTISYGLSVSGSPGGKIGSGSLTVINSNSIYSYGTGSMLTLTPNADWVNTGTIQAQAGSTTLITGGGTITQQGAGQILASGGTMDLEAITIDGGTLTTSNGGFIKTFGLGPNLSFLTNNGQYSIGNGPSSATVNLIGTITNNGAITLIFTGHPATLAMKGSVVLTGSGSVTLGGSATAMSGGTLTNQQSISGVGSIKVGTLVNQGTITAAAANGSTTLTLKPSTGTLTNMGTITAINGSTADIIARQVTNAGGTISASGGGAVALLDNGVTVTGGTVDGETGGYVEGKSATLDGTSSPVTVKGLFNVLNGDITFLKGTITGVGNIAVEGGVGDATLHVKGTTIIEGGVSVDLGNDSPNSLLVGDGSTLSKLTFQGSTLEGNGLASGMKVTIDPTSTVECLLNATPLEFDATTSVLIQGSMLNPTGCTIKFDANLLNFNSSNATLTGGTFNLSGPVEQPGNIQTLNANVILNNSIAELENLSGGNALSTMASIGNKGALTVGSTVVLQLNGALTSAGTVNLDSQGYLDVGSGGLTQTSGTFNNSGTLNLPLGGVFTATGGTIEGSNGTFNGSVTAGNQTGATVTVLLGPTKKAPGLLTVTNNLTLNPTNVVTVPIISSTQGSGYGAVNVTDTATLGGTLNLTRPTGYIPPIGTVFTIFNGTGGVSGTFATVNGLSINQNEHFSVGYNPNIVFLNVVAGPSSENEISGPSPTRVGRRRSITGSSR